MPTFPSLMFDRVLNTPLNFIIEHSEKITSPWRFRFFYWVAYWSKFSWNEGTSINISSTTHQRKTPQEKILEFFLLDSLKTVFQMRHSTHRWTQSLIRVFFPKLRVLFFNFKKGQARPHPRPPYVWWILGQLFSFQITYFVNIGVLIIQQFWRHIEACDTSIYHSETLSQALDKFAHEMNH